MKNEELENKVLDSLVFIYYIICNENLAEAVTVSYMMHQVLKNRWCKK